MEQEEKALCWLEETLWGFVCNHCQTVLSNKVNPFETKECPNCGSIVYGVDTLV